MTLIELLVVITILGLLSITVLPRINQSIESRRSREAARNLLSFISRAQTRALNAETPMGMMLVTQTANPYASSEASFATTPPAYSGEWSATRVLFYDRDFTAKSLVDLELEPVNFAAVANPQTLGRLYLRFVVPAGGGIADDTATLERLTFTDTCSPGDSIQFGGIGPWFRFQPPVAAGQAPSITMWDSKSQNPGNLSWPRADAQGIPFRIRRQPATSSAGVMQLQQTSAVDLTWSCVGRRPLGTLISDPTQPVTLLFDALGRPFELVHSGGERLPLFEPLFILLGSPELAGNTFFDPTAPPSGGDDEDTTNRSGVNWQYTDSVWTVVDPLSGAVKFAPASPIPPGTPSMEEALDASQAAVRASIALGVSDR